MKERQTAVRMDEHGVYRVADTRVMLESVVYPYLNGQSPECIHDQYPALTLQQIDGAIIFFNDNRAEVDAYLARQEKLLEELRRRQERENGPFLQKLLTDLPISSRQE